MCAGAHRSKPCHVFLKAFFRHEWSSIQLERPKLPVEIQNRVAVDEGYAGFPREKRHHGACSRNIATRVFAMPRSDPAG
jgi:hypothetical protein